MNNAAEQVKETKREDEDGRGSKVDENADDVQRYARKYKQPDIGTCKKKHAKDGRR